MTAPTSSYSATCPACNVLASLQESGRLHVHFATVKADRPCWMSYHPVSDYEKLKERHRK